MTSKEEHRLFFYDKWKDLVFRRIKAVKLGNPSMVADLYEPIKESNGDEETGKESNCANIDDCVNHIPCYSHLYGVTNGNVINKGDLYPGHRIYFSHGIKQNKSEYCSIDLYSGQGSTAWFPDKHKCCDTPSSKTQCEQYVISTNPPRKNQYVCGMVHKNKDGQYCYTKWFVCSREFMNLWSLIVENPYNLRKCMTTTSITKEDVVSLLNFVDCTFYNRLFATSTTDDGKGKHVSYTPRTINKNKMIKNIQQEKVNIKRRYQNYELSCRYTNIYRDIIFFLVCDNYEFRDETEVKNVIRDA